MNRNLTGALLVAIVATLAGCGGGRSSLLPAQSAQSSSVRAPNALKQVGMLEAERTLHDVCGPVAPEYARCYAIATAFAVRAVKSGVQPDGGSCTLDQPPCYGPEGLQSAYNVTQESLSGGKGMTIALVDAYAYPTAKSDLMAYRQQFGLKKLCSTCLKIVNQTGGTKLPPASDEGWDQEQAIDLDMISAICPNCKIVLVQAGDSYNTNMYAGVATALKEADIVSLSWGGAEFVASYALFDKHPGHVITASAGDNGAGPQQPCSFQGVVCVGGTSLKPSSSARGWSEVVWNDLVNNHCGNATLGTPCATGSGCSAMVSKPKWQTDKGCTMRSESDVSAVADPYTGVLFLYNGQCCYSTGGTSVASPIIAGIYGLAGNATTATPATLWAQGGMKSFNDVTKGTNENITASTYICPPSYGYICKARKGYDGPTGWGTPNGVGAF